VAAVSGLDAARAMEVAAEGGNAIGRDCSLEEAVAAMRSDPLVCQSVHAAGRRMAMLLHSGGHLLDHCMGELGMLARPASDGKAMPGMETRAEGSTGLGLRPGKGYHFSDGPFVEYEGTVPAPIRTSLVEALNRELAAASAGPGVPTLDRLIRPSDASELASVGLTQSDCAHLPADQPSRIVCIGSSTNGCPCGGTHVPSTSAFSLGLPSGAESGGDMISSGSGEVHRCRLLVTKLKVKKGKTSVKYTCSFD